MAQSLRVEDLDRLVLVWLCVPRKKPDQASLATALKPYATALGLAAESLTRQSLARLRARGDIEADTTFMLSPAGKAKALAALGLPGLPKRASWRWLQSVLVTRGIPADPTPAALRRAGKPEDLAAAVLQHERNIQSTTALSLAQVANALAWREIGIDSTAPFTQKAVLAHILHRSGPQQAALAGKASARDVARAIAAADLGAARGHAPLQAALVQRWLCGPETSAGAPRQAVESSPRAMPPEKPTVAAADDPAALRAFAERVAAAAGASKSGRWGEHKVFVSDVWEEVRRAGGGPMLDLDAFKSQLVRANQAGLLFLSRADLVEAMDAERVARSEIAALGTTFHFIRMD